MRSKANSSNLLIAAVLALQFSLRAESSKHPPPEGRFHESWMELRMLGKKAGHSRVTVQRSGEFVISRTQTMIKINRSGSELSIAAKEEAKETLDGQMVGFTRELNMGGTPLRIEGVIEDKSIKVTTEQFGRKKERTHDLDERGLMNWGLLRLMRVEGFSSGTTYDAWIYSPEFGMEAPTKVTVKVLGEEELLLPIGKRYATRISMLLHSKAGKLESQSWLDEDGFALQARMKLGGIQMEMKSTSKATALESFATADLFSHSMHPLHGSETKNARAVTYRMKMKSDSEVGLSPPNGYTQTVEASTDGFMIVKVKRSDLKEVTEGKGNPTEVASRYRKPNVMIDSNDPSIRKLAKFAARGAGNPIAMAKQLRVFVTNYINRKTLEIGFATASEVARTRSGDCTEHAVLLAALGRSKGLPARVAAGLVYLPEHHGSKNLMGFHMWTQFYLRGKWVDFDAALGESECSPTRITLTTASLSDVSLAEIGFALAEAMEHLEIRIVEIER